MSSLPGWVKFVSIIAVIAGLLGLIQDIKLINTEDLLKIQDKILEKVDTNISDDEVEEIQDFIEALGGDDNDNDNAINDSSEPATLQNAIKQLTHISPESMKTLARHGYLGVGISIAFILMGIYFWRHRPKALSFMRILLVISLLFVGYQVWEMRSLDISPLFALGININLYAGAVIDILLLIVIGISDKSIFYPEA